MRESKKSSARVLVVDDHRPTLMAIEALLGSIEVAAVTVASATEALRWIADETFALVLLDMNLPDLDGTETARRIRATDRGRQTPIMILTAEIPSASRVLASYDAGAIDYLVKPFPPELLRSKVRVFVELHAMREELRDRERAEQQQAHQKRVRALFDAMPIAVCAIRADGSVELENRLWRQLVEHSGQGVVERLVAEAIQSPPAGKVDAAAVIDVERMLRTQSGVERSHLIRIVPELDGHRGRTAWVATALDIDEQKRAARLIASASAAKDEFLRVASHELNTPVAALTLQIQRLQKSAHQSPELEPLASGIDRAAGHVRRLTLLIEELLHASRMLSEPVTVRPSKVNLRQVVDTVVAGIRPRAEHAGSPIVVIELEPCIGQWDATWLERLVHLLLDNAVTYGAGKPIEMRIERPERVDLSRLVVADRGIGIAPEAAERVFERFERDVSAMRYSGFGLGLWMARRIASAFDGALRLEPRDGGGTVAILDLPHAGAAAVAAAP